VFLLAAGLWAVRSGTVRASVPVAAERIAVFPFNATGSAEVREFGVGMVDLLSTALNDVGGIRTVASRSVFARLDGEQRTGGDVPLETAYAIGRELGAGSVLTGSVTPFGTDVRMAAELRDALSGSVLASAEVQGVQDDMLDLTDRLAVGLLRELWRSRGPVPTVRTAALTTSSPMALRAYLRAENHFRALSFDSAAEWLNIAIQADSSFALAWGRLGDVVSWSTTAGDGVVIRREHLRRALALGDRLPERERALLRAVELHVTGSFAAFDSLHAFVQRYPDDPMGWYYLGDARFHASYLGRYEDHEISQPFLESVRLDPTFGLGLQHLLDVSRNNGDRVTFDSAMTAYARVADVRRVERLRRQADVRWAPADSILSVLAGSVRGRHPVEDRSEVNALIGAVGVRSRTDVAIDPRIYVMALDTVGRIFETDSYWQRRMARLRWLSFGSLGRGSDALNAIDQFLNLDPPNLPPMPRDVVRAQLRVGTALQGHAALEDVAADARLIEQNSDAAPWLPGMLHAYYTRTGQRDRAARYRAGFVTPELPPGARDVDLDAFTHAVNGWLKLEAYGDTVGGLAMLEEGLDQLGYEDANYLGVPWRDYGKVLVTIPERRRQGIRMLRRSIVWEAGGVGDAWLALARALETAGDRAGAREAYAHVLRFWQDADSFRRSDHEEARQGVVRLREDAGA
jgi:TolB-like protein